MGLFSDAITLVVTTEPDVAIDGDGTNGNLTIDFGFYIPPATMSIGDLVWLDLNDNATFDTLTEVGIPNVVLSIYHDVNENSMYEVGADTLISTTSTDASGHYLFSNLAQGQYFVGVNASNWQASSTLQGLVSSNTFTMPDFDVNNYDKGFDHLSIDSMAQVGLVSGVMTLIANTEPDTLVDGDDKNSNLTMDWGFFQALTVAGTIWNDGIAGDGILDTMTESGQGKVSVQLIQDNGNGIYEKGVDAVLGLSVTNSDGLYLFSFLQDGGDYFIVLPSTNTTNINSEVFEFMASSNSVPENPAMDNVNHAVSLADSTIVSTLFRLNLNMEPDVAIDGDGPNINSTIDFGLSAPPARLSVRILLGGAYDETSGLLRDDLRASALIPITEPHTDKELFLTDQENLVRGGESITDSMAVFSITGNNAIVDWIYVELRSVSDSTKVVASRSGLVQRDGDIVDVDGISPLTFSDAPAGNYYVAIRHRNHLGVMSANPVKIYGSKVVDFTNPAAPNGLTTWGTATQQQQLDGKFSLWPGNANSDNKVTFDGNNNDKDRISALVVNAEGNSTFSSNFILVGYAEEDINLDGTTKFDGSENDKDDLSVLVITHSDNNTFATNYIIFEQLPQ